MCDMCAAIMLLWSYDHCEPMVCRPTQYKKWNQCLIFYLSPDHPKT